MSRAVPAFSAPPGDTPARPENSEARRWMESQNEIGEMRADFFLTVEKAGPDGQDWTGAGKIWLAAGRKYRVNYEKPEPQILVSNGAQRWLYLKKINQVQVQSLPPEGNPAEFFLELGGGLAGWLARCQTERLSALEKPGWRVFALTPRPGKELGFTQVRLWVRGRERVPRRVEVDSERRVRIEFKRLEVFTRFDLKWRPGLGVPKDWFTFSAPPGAEVIEMDLTKLR